MTINFKKFETYLINFLDINNKYVFFHKINIKLILSRLVPQESSKSAI